MGGLPAKRAAVYPAPVPRHIHWQLQVQLNMRQDRHYLGFVLAWSVVAMLNEVLNGYAAELNSLTPRSVWLGLLFLTASVIQCLRVPAGAGQQACRAAADRICAALYLALFLSTGLPAVAWRCLDPTDLNALNGLRHGASIAFELGLLTLLLVRFLSTLKSRGLLNRERTSMKDIAGP